ncbi:Spore maturation protein CgeB [Geosporobacter subterraneus DSM 17957]|uniref:Spore maturation protein CgeB n=1 Tax=Geosporobacter subterraneus DSM 17957 TaxID=1121919 RepID=A0A1M6PKX6_9FIRM|nr:glycosyltransferase [Geosporobacter subterraneus]SHK08548.1 Spore maturation protein CgeB [Geosporobacter subterraneus DSM 17957]
MKILFIHECVTIIYSLKPGLEKIGHEAKVFDMRKYPFGEQKNKLIAKIESFKPDYIFIHGDPPGLNWSALWDVRKAYKIPMIYWAVEDPLYHNQLSRGIAEKVDYVFTPCVELLKEYQRMGKKSQLLLFSCNPKFHKTLPPCKSLKHDIVLVGSNYKERATTTAKILQPLIDNNYDLMVWGNSWWIDRNLPFSIPEKYYGGFLPYCMLPWVYNSAKIVLGVHLDNTSLTQTSMRTFEALGCGSFYLSQYTKAHEQLFKRGVHLEWADTTKDLLRLVDHYLSNDADRNSIGHTGQEFVYKNHSCYQRAHTLTDFLIKNK